MKHEIIYLPIGKLKPNPDNPRLIRDANFKRLVKSLKDCPRLFDARPCICSDRTGDLIVMGGNMRLRAAKELKYSEVPVIVMSGLTPEEEREIVVKDNGENFGEFDFDLLANNWSDEPLKDWGSDRTQGEQNPEGDDNLCRVRRVPQRRAVSEGCRNGYRGRGRTDTSEHVPSAAELPEFAVDV